jgi:hypothetical protein
VLAAERETADVGIVTLRTAILVNAGAVVALLAFVGQLWASQKAVLAAVLGHAYWFFLGLAAALAASVVAYCFVEMKSAREDRRYFAMLNGKDALPLGDPDSPARPATGWPSWSALSFSAPTDLLPSALGACSLRWLPRSHLRSALRW